MKTLLFALVLTTAAYAENYSFQTFKLGPKLTARQNQIHFFQKNGFSTEDIDTENDLYQRIIEAIGDSYQSIGSTLTGNLIKLNEGFDLGQSNYQGINWQKPFGNFSIGVNRQLSPDLFDDDRWIVDDQFTILINASTYLSNLANAGEIDITEETLAAYAGISFKRTYRYVHFADSFKKGLIADYSKLFMSFLKFRGAKILDMPEYEILSKQDHISLQAGGLISTPDWYGASVTGGVLATYERLSKVVVQSLGPNDASQPGERIRLSVEKEKGKELAGGLKLQADFFNLLKITLLSYDISYKYSETDKNYLTFFKDDIHSIKNSSAKTKELKSLLRLKKIRVSELKDYLTGQEYREEENFKSKYSVLIWGGEAARDTKTTVLEKNEGKKVFLEHSMKSTRFTEKIKNKLAGVIFAALFKSDKYLAQYKESTTRKLRIEFAVDEDDVVGGNYDGITSLDSIDKISLVLGQEYKSRKEYKSKKKWQKSTEKKDVLKYLRDMTPIQNDIKTRLNNGMLQGPFAVTVNYRINKESLKYFNGNPRTFVLQTLKNICHEVENQASKREFCIKELEGKYKAYIIPYLASGKIKVEKLKYFLYALMKRVNKMMHFTDLFGENKFFISGTLEATTEQGDPFMTFFDSGVFVGLGVIDDYKRQNGILSPAPIFDH